MFLRRAQLMRRLIARHPGWLALVAAFLLALALAILLIGLALLANPETWYFRTAEGAACGDGDRESLSESAGSSTATKVLDSTGATWNRTETTRSIGAGNWQVLFDATTGSGSGPTNKVTVLVERRTSPCSVQQEIINEQITLTEGTTTEYSTTVTDSGMVSFDTGDILTVTP